MAESLTSTVECIVSWNFANARDNSTVKDASKLRHYKSFTAGSGDSQLQQMWHDRRYVTTASGTDDIDLAGALTNVFGTSITFTAIKTLMIENLGVPTAGLEGGTYTPTSGEDLIVGAAGAGEWNNLFDGLSSGKIHVKSGGVFVISAPLDGIAVAAGTNDILRVSHDGTQDIVYKIVVTGITG